MTAAAPDPLVTVFIPTRNRRELLQRALASVWNQGREDVEVIVVDDASGDGTAEYLQEVGRGGKLRHFRNDSPEGACVARNRAIREARGRFVTGLDDDDEFLPGRIDAFVAAWRPTDAFVCSAHIQIEPDGSEHYRPCAAVIDLQSILSRNVASTIFAERDKILACGGFDERLPAGQDYDLWIRMVHAHGPGRGLAEPLQRVHASASGRISTSSRRRHGYWMVYCKHKHLMRARSRAIHLYNLHQSSGKRLGLGNAIRFAVQGNRMRVLSRLLKQSVPSAAPAIVRAAEFAARMVRR